MRLRTSNDMHLFSAVNLMQDAVEAFLIAVAESVETNLDSKTAFDKYFIQIDEKISPKKLPFKSKLLRLNRIRVDSKHHGIQPARDECERLALAVCEFFEETCESLLGSSFSTVSVVDLLNEGETKNVLLEAKKDLEEGRIQACAINCRKALYLEIERQYDISGFKNGLNFLAAFTKAPTFAQNLEYIDTYVLDPTDFIVYEHSSVNEQLLVQGADNTAFWNVWRLTPEVYKTTEGHWIVKYDFGKLDDEILRDKIEYIFSATLDVVLSIHRTSHAIQWSNTGRFYVNLKAESAPIFRKADRRSEVVAHTPENMGQIGTDFRIDGLNEDGIYWHIAHSIKGQWLYGFIHEDFIDTTQVQGLNASPQK